MGLCSAQHPSLYWLLFSCLACSLPVSFTGYPLIMVNFMCQIAWVTGCPDIWLHISGCVCEGFCMRLMFELITLSKGGCLPQCGWVSSSLLKAWVKQKAGQNQVFSLFDCLQAGTSVSCLRTWTQTGIYTIISAGSQVCLLRLELYHLLSCVSSSLTTDLGLLSLHNHLSQATF